MKIYRLSSGVTTTLLIIASSGQAQETAQPGQVAESAVGQVGQCQTASSSQTIEPTSRRADEPS